MRDPTIILSARLQVLSTGQFGSTTQLSYEDRMDRGAALLNGAETVENCVAGEFCSLLFSLVLWDTLQIQNTLSSTELTCRPSKALRSLTESLATASCGTAHHMDCPTTRRP